MRTSYPVMRKRYRPERPTSKAGTQRAENQQANPETRPNPTRQTVLRPSRATRKAMTARLRARAPGGGTVQPRRRQFARA